jgi:hypothetical protein
MTDHHREVAAAILRDYFLRHAARVAEFSLDRGIHMTAFPPTLADVTAAAQLLADLEPQTTLSVAE